MPTMPPTFRPGGARTAKQADLDYEAERRRAKPWRKWYSLAIWKAIRATQLGAQPLCERCLAKSEITVATTVNHKQPHRGIWERFVAGPFESLCKLCHDSDAQRDDRRTEG